MKLPVTKVQNLGIRLEFRGESPGCVSPFYLVSQPLAASFIMVYHQPAVYLRTFYISSLVLHGFGNM